ncbi:hypothetical protein GE09DRAFT_139346 [Coniochaeta sp. 2T2.1]|nr:hypothetical protein GE09DRAFT_139346 [Coniochaeta sp. 2T2.1]
MVSSLISGKSSSGKKSDRKEEKKSKQADPSDNSVIICMTIFIFRGEPDFYYNRHVLTSPDNPNYHETVHTQRGEDGRWTVDRIHREVNWAMTATYIGHVNAGMVLVPGGQEMMPVNIAAAIRVAGRENNSDWNCQHFLLEGLYGMVQGGLQTEEWYIYVEDALMTSLMDGAVE